MNTENNKILRKEILLELKPFLKEEDVIVAALAGTTTDCYQALDRPGILYAVGMGMVTPVGFGLSLALPRRRIIALDTDGSLLLSPSILAVIGVYKPKNFRMLVFDNERLFGSRGGPPSPTAYGTNLAALASAAGIARADIVRDSSSIKAKLSWFVEAEGPSILIAKVEGVFSPAPKPNVNGQENKYQLVRLLEKTEKIEILEPAK